MTGGMLRRQMVNPQVRTAAQITAAPFEAVYPQTEGLTMNSRPKQPKYARNKNILVIGGSGSGKTRFFVKPSAPVRAV